MGTQDLSLFAYEHLPEELQEISKPFHDLAARLVDMVPSRSDQLEVALQKLLESKDAAVRSRLPR